MNKTGVYCAKCHTELVIESDEPGEYNLVKCGNCGNNVDWKCFIAAPAKNEHERPKTTGPAAPDPAREHADWEARFFSTLLIYWERFNKRVPNFEIIGAFEDTIRLVARENMEHGIKHGREEAT